MITPETRLTVTLETPGRTAETVLSRTQASLYSAVSTQNTVCWQIVIQVCEIMPSCANCSVQIAHCAHGRASVYYGGGWLAWLPGCLLVHSIIRVSPITSA